MPAPKSWLPLALSGVAILGLGGLHLARALRRRADPAPPSGEPPARPIPADDVSDYLKATYGQPTPTRSPEEAASASESGPVYQGNASEELWASDELPPLHVVLTGSTRGGMAQVSPEPEEEPTFAPFSPRPREEEVSDWYLPLDRARLSEGMAYPGDFCLADDPELHWLGGKLWARAVSQLPKSEDEEGLLQMDRQTYTVRRLDADAGATYIHLRRRPQ